MGTRRRPGCKGCYAPLMFTRRPVLLVLHVLVLVLVPVLVAPAQDEVPNTLRQAPPKRPVVSTLTWDVDGVERSALVQVPVLAEDERAPLVFIWHGHGGSSQRAATRFRLTERWPEAILVHPQGLKTPGFTDPEGLRSGWTSKGVPAEDNRDLHFFDVMLADFLERGIVDPELIYSTGQSNGGGFTYTLFFERGDRLAAIAPASCAASRQLRRGQSPPMIPIFHLAGSNDGVVKMAWQQRTIDHFVTRHQCGAPEPWGDHPDCVLHPSALGAPVITYVHTQGHSLPKDAGRLFAKFFREHARSVTEKRASPPAPPAAPEPTESSTAPSPEGDE